MSIAASVAVKPSRILQALTAGMSTLVLLIGVAIGAGRIGQFALPARMLLAAACIFAGFTVCYRTVQSRKTRHIDISGKGQIRLTENSAVVSLPGMAGANSPYRAAGPDGELVTLMADSTLWPCLLLLRLQTEDRRVIILPVLPDSVEEGGFRNLAVACRWIAAHNNPQDHARP